MPVSVVDVFEAIEVGEQDRRGGVRTLAALGGVVEPLLQQQPVGQAGKGVVQCTVPKGVRGGLRVVARVGIEQVGRRHVGQRLGRGHVPRPQLAGSVTVEIQRAEAAVPVVQWKREDGGETGGRCGWCEARVAGVAGEIGYQDRTSEVVGREAGAFADIGLQLFEAQR